MSAAVHRNHRGDLAQGLLEAGLARLELGEFDTARQLFTKAEALFGDVHKDHTTPARADLLVGMARIHLQGQDYVSALRSAQKADLFWRDFDPDNRGAGEAALWLGRSYLALGRNAEAAEPLARARKVLSRSPIPADATHLRLALAAKP